MNTPQNVKTPLINSVILADKAINKLYNLHAAEENYRRLANEEIARAKNAKSGKILLRIFSPLLALYCSLFVSYIFLSLLKNRDSYAFNIFSFVLFCTLFCLCIIVCWRYPFKRNEHLNAAAKYEQLARQTARAIENFTCKYENLISLIPEQYRFPLATNYLVEVFQTGRATTLPEAFDRLEEQMHRWNVERTIQSAFE